MSELLASRETDGEGDAGRAIPVEPCKADIADQITRQRQQQWRDDGSVEDDVV
jgi:hypothetical protein